MKSGYYEFISGAYKGRTGYLAELVEPDKDGNKRAHMYVFNDDDGSQKLAITNCANIKWIEDQDEMIFKYAQGDGQGGGVDEV